MNHSALALAALGIFTTTPVVTADVIRGSVSLPATGVPGEGPCGPISDVMQQAIQAASVAISAYSKGAVPPNVLESLILRSGLVRADHSACEQVCIVAPGNYKIWFESTRWGNWPWYCGGHRRFFDADWSRALHIDSHAIDVDKGYYLICATFQNWSHDQSLNASLTALPPNQDWQWPANCGDSSLNTTASAH